MMKSERGIARADRERHHPHAMTGPFRSLRCLALHALFVAGLTGCVTSAGPDSGPRDIPVQVASDGHALPGSLYIAAGPGPHPTVVWFHGFPGVPAPDPVAVATLREAGLNVLWLHYRGSWGTQGTFAPDNALADAAAALAAIHAAPSAWRVDPDRVIAIGDSFGSWVALQAAADDDRVGCVAAALVLDLGRTGRDLAASAEMRAAFGTMFAQVAGDAALGYRLEQGSDGLLEAIIEGVDGHELRSRAPDFRDRLVLLLGATDDTLAPVDAHLAPVAEAFERNGARLTTMVLPGGHELSDADYMPRIADWIGRECLRER